MTEASEPKRRSFADGIKFGRYLERTGLIDYRPLRLRYEAGLRKGEFSGLWAYWDSQPWLMRLGKTLIRQEIFREKDNPFYPFPSQDDFEGEITLGAINPNGGLFRFSRWCGQRRRGADPPGANMGPSASGRAAGGAPACPPPGPKLEWKLLEV